MEEPKFFSPFEEVRSHGERLPHWQQVGATYFITFRLADSVPTDRLAEWKAERDEWKRNHPEPWSEEVEADYHRRFSGAIDTWLDRGAGSCLLREAAHAELVAEVLRHQHATRYWLHAFVVMPNHLHVLASLREGERLEEVVKSWKGVSSRRLNRRREASGPVWQRDYFDRLVRDQDHFFRVARYIRANPEKGRLAPGSFLLWESSFTKEMLGEEDG